MESGDSNVFPEVQQVSGRGVTFIACCLFISNRHFPGCRSVNCYSFVHECVTPLGSTVTK